MSSRCRSEKRGQDLPIQLSDFRALFSRSIQLIRRATSGSGSIAEIPLSRRWVATPDPVPVYSRHEGTHQDAGAARDARRGNATGQTHRGGWQHGGAAVAGRRGARRVLHAARGPGRDLPHRHARARAGRQVRPPSLLGTVRAARMKLVCAALVLFSAAPALAHQSSVVYQEFQVSGHDVYDTVQIASPDLFEALGTKDITPSLLRERRREVYDYVAAKVHLTNFGQPCPASFDGFEVNEKTSGFFAGVRLRFACARQAELLAIDYDLFFDLDARHQCFARLDTGDGVLHEFVFRRDQRRWDVSRPVTALGHVWEYLQMGVAHIFTGYDHILFLIGLLVVAGNRGLRPGFVYTLKLIARVTVPHSIMLICAALRWVTGISRSSES